MDEVAVNLRFYFDVQPGIEVPRYTLARLDPTTRIPGAKRYRFDVEIDDPTEPDEVVMASSVVVESVE